MFPNKTQNTVNLQFLAQVEDLDQCSRYNWGSALLAGLYSGLNETSQYTVHDATGCPYLLQVRISSTPPFRDQLTSLRVEDFRWQPYAKVLHRLPDFCEVLHNIRVSSEKFREKREEENLLDEELDKHLDDIINQTHAALTLGANDEMDIEDTQILVDEEPSLPSQPAPDYLADITAIPGLKETREYILLSRKRWIAMEAIESFAQELEGLERRRKMAIHLYAKTKYDKGLDIWKTETKHLLEELEEIYKLGKDLRNSCQHIYRYIPRAVEVDNLVATLRSLNELILTHGEEVAAIAQLMDSLDGWDPKIRVFTSTDHIPRQTPTGRMIKLAIEYTSGPMAPTGSANEQDEVAVLRRWKERLLQSIGRSFLGHMTPLVKFYFVGLGSAGGVVKNVLTPVAGENSCFSLTEGSPSILKFKFYVRHNLVFGLNYRNTFLIGGVKG
ncbi:OLC1v1008789C1 [Oldenlandia corymbosa var. corymbosa]|uniref:OLC1v1008789C1 n=1 Tax=Oldenlandia corymbosa var. corymbosa TaxID=529605 RepID=A0AAV1DNY3_OLDCO|nr:OLC1v1008789C1 [Oldenlandia corymbosa var. corymbosa]